MLELEPRFSSNPESLLSPDDYRSWHKFRFGEALDMLLITSECSSPVSPLWIRCSSAIE